MREAIAAGSRVSVAENNSFWHYYQRRRKKDKPLISAAYTKDCWCRLSRRQPATPSQQDPKVGGRSRWAILYVLLAGEYGTELVEANFGRID